MTSFDQDLNAALVYYQDVHRHAGHKAQWFYAIGEDRKAIWFQHKQREAYQRMNELRDWFHDQ